MTDHLDWTQAVGVAFEHQGRDVMDAVQRWRTTAVQTGALASSPQLDVFQQGTQIIIYCRPQAVV